MADFINKYPYTDFHELNLDWILEKVKEMDSTITTWTALNVVKFADPIDWNQSTYYEKYTIVMGPDGNSYLSKHAVPVGILYSNTDYWMKVADYNAQMARLQNTTNFGTMYKYLTGKKVLIFGDSVCNLENSWTEQLSNVGIDVTNRAVDGSALTTQYSPNGYNIISSTTDLNDFDVVMIAYGANDWSTSSNNGSEADTTDFKYCLEACVNYIHTQNASVDIILVTPTYAYRQFSWSDLPNYNYRGMTTKDYADTVKNCAAKHNLKCVDMYTMIGVDSSNYTVMMNSSSGIYIHPKTEMLNRMYNNLIYAPIYDSVTDQNEIKAVIPHNSPVSSTDITTVPARYRHYACVKTSSTITLGTYTMLTDITYIFEGYASNQITVSIGAHTFTVAGTFKISYTPTAVERNTMSFIPAGSNVIVAGMRLYNNKGIPMNETNVVTALDNVSVSAGNYVSDAKGLHLEQMVITYTGTNIARYTQLVHFSDFENLSSDALYLYANYAGQFIWLYITSGNLISAYQVTGTNPTIIIPSQDIVV